MSSIPTALDALVQVMRLVLPTETQVFDGPPTEELENDFVAVGYSDERNAVEVDTSREGLAGDNRERYDIACMISTYDGDIDAGTRPLRTRAFDLYNLITTELRRDPRLGGVVLSARPTIVLFDPFLTDRGARADLAFLVACDAFA